MALYCLRDMGAADPTSVAIAMTALADPEPAVRLAALSAAMVLAPRSGDAAGRVAALVRDVDAGVARAAAATLGRIGADTIAVRAALEWAVASADAALRRAAETSLSRLAGDARGSR